MGEWKVCFGAHLVRVQINPHWIFLKTKNQETIVQVGNLEK